MHEMMTCTSWPWALFFWPLVGVDPLLGGVGYPFR